MKQPDPSFVAYRVGPETKRLEHRALTVDDAEAYFALNTHPDIMRYIHEPLLKSVEEARAAIANYPDFDTVGYGRWGCVLKANRSVIGFCGLKYLPELEAVDVGFRFLPEYWGRGLATEAAAASIVFGFKTLGLQRIIGLVLPENGASIRVLEKVGMRRQGIFTYQGLSVLRFEIDRARYQNLDAPPTGAAPPPTPP